VKKKICIAFIVTSLLTGVGSATFIDITIRGVGNSQADKNRNLEAMLWDDTTLSLVLVSGLNPIRPKEGIGDIFIDFNSLIASASSPFGSEIKNPGMEACIDITGGNGKTLEYSLATLSENSIVQSSGIPAFPWKLVASSFDSVIMNGTTHVETMDDNDIKQLLGINVGGCGDDETFWDKGNSHYVTSFNMTSMVPYFTSSSNVTFYQTEQCGDIIKGSLNFSAVPEPSTFFSAGMLLMSGLFFRSRRTK
jgi:hypothetical protein